jgi:hypothetical protein
MSISLTDLELRLLVVARQIAAASTLITYTDLNVRAQLGLNLANPQDRIALSWWLRRICEHELAEDRPLIVVVVVREDSLEPGKGFFKMVDDLASIGGQNRPVNRG